MRLLSRLAAVASLFLPLSRNGPIDRRVPARSRARLLWIQGTMLGNVATAVAVMAVAAVGFGMLTGRMNWRFGAIGHHRRVHHLWRRHHRGRYPGRGSGG